MANDTKANWQNVDVETLPSTIREHYDAYKAAYAEMKEARGTFEVAMRTALMEATPKGKRLAIAYNFGKLSVAIVEDDRKASASPKAISLSDLIKR